MHRVPSHCDDHCKDDDDDDDEDDEYDIGNSIVYRKAKLWNIII